MRRPSGHFLYPAARAYELVYQDPHLLEIDRTAQERVETMLPHMMEVAGAAEELKARNPMRWAGLMNTLKAQVEEVLLQELVYI